ncbi:putative surface protein with fasciclin (FAS1) repeats [Stackebrandtia albiflava]|uniref:Putative surface protein with fasciclin (FAS1) repeats n=1 Tax=Stackebrandtia albiflava TaxID=406432 RepID=A0A562VAP2_9ACTN|nr:fasciclin domain-containing protein [Stackebrandtia albiflava]TWJ14934.1 putative surface protein with fasciclin (FAS1) repeats [Stackebrandtia albiflava]
MFSNRRTRFAAAAGTIGLALVLTACSGGEDDATAEDSTDTGVEETTAAEDDGMDAAAPFGPACESIPKDGEGSFDGMADDPVATAASNNPALSTLVAAVTAAELGDTLNSAENITVFAPTDDAFDKIPEEDLNALLEDKDMLTQVLTYHVVGQSLTPEALGTEGPFTTLQGEQVEVSGSGEDFTVNGESKVVCGNVPTANATVYIVDTVLMPPAE